MQAHLVSSHVVISTSNCIGTAGLLGGKMGRRRVQGKERKTSRGREDGLGSVAMGRRGRTEGNEMGMMYVVATRCFTVN